MTMLSDPQDRPTILIVEDEEGPRNALKIILRPFYNLAMAGNRGEALHVLEAQPVDLVTLDLKLPDGHGLNLFHVIQQTHPGTEIVIITGYGTLKSSREAVQHGAAGYLLKPFNVTDLITLIDRTLARKRHLDGIRSFLRSSSGLWSDDRMAAEAWASLRDRFPSSTPHQSVPPLPDPRERAALALAADLLEATDRRLLARASRVCGYAALLAEALNLNQRDQRALTIGAFLHDLGYVPLGRLTEERLGQIGETDGVETRHPMLGVRMAAPLGVPEAALKAIAHHHERYDGSGFPDGLAGERIPLLARIVGIAEMFDRLAWPSSHTPVALTDACASLGALAGTALDPGLVDRFLERIAERERTGSTSRHV